ncbi:cytochrome P450 3A24-like [Montipora capricornis]|uniref:cytochrome P450 3A24-like n=1 Tax=Montipora capricornis TaxID=246305 RepID=UPI0035F1CD46
MSLQHDPSCLPILKIIVNAFPRIFSLCRYIDVFQNVDYLCAVAKDILEKRQKQGFPGTKDLVQLMLKAHEEHVDSVSKLSDDEIMAQSIVFLVAGFETTGKRKQYPDKHCIFSCKIPEVQDRLIREIDELINTHEDEPLYELIHKAGYMDQVISEVLRLCGPALLLIRECTEDAIYKGIRIPEGCGINIPVYVLHRDPDLWDNPLETHLHFFHLVQVPGSVLVCGWHC